ncbi:DNA polymerase IV [Sciscionella marina]|uniref:DNA polymerase IV n=1 Tax=Sciscionella marina TaxID=508770 RepID=UPI0006880344|nr:DNA polymerase IV [Sciscionella marina]
MGRSGQLPRGSSAYRATPDRPWPSDEGCPILHVDMDAFFASVSTRERPDLADKPVVVAGGGVRGVVSSANYIAREYGVRSAMPASRARTLCPHAVFLEPEFEQYAAVSRDVMALFREMTPLVEPVSLDEAFLDVSGALRRLRSTPAQLGERLRARVFAAHRVSCSVGVGPSKFIAKLSSGLAKPDGMVVVPRGEVLDFLHPLPVSALWGVGEVTERKLRSYGMETVGDIAEIPLARLRKLVGNAAAEHLHTLASGVDERRVTPHNEEKSLGAETTFEYDYEDPDVLRRELLRLSGRVAAGLRRKGLRARTISIKVRYSDFRTITRAYTMHAATDSSREVYRHAERLLSTAVAPGPIRLLGVRTEGLGETEHEPTQLEFAAETEDSWREAEVAADKANERFGGAMVRPASLLSGGARRGNNRHDS